MADNQQYKWRQRKKRNTKIGIWIAAVVAASGGGTFAYEGMKGSDPLNAAKAYIKQTTGVDEVSVETGDRSLNSDNQFVQDYTFTYTVDGKEVTRKVNMVQQNEKKFGLFDQWNVQTAATNASDMELIVPTVSQVLIDGVAPAADSVKEDENLSPGAVCYQLTGVDRDTAKVQMAGLPFDNYEGPLAGTDSVMDLRDSLNISENAKTQMEEIGKSMINELYTAVMQEKGEEGLGEQFAKVPNKGNLYKAIYGNLFRDGALQTEEITFENFKATFGEVYYPGKDEESYVGVEMKLAYDCKYDAGGEEAETEETQAESETEEGAAQTESGTAVHKEATFYFRYQKDGCVVTSAEVPGVL